MSFGKGSNTTTQSTSPSPQAMQSYSDLLSRAQGVSQTPYTPYGGQMVAPINQQQNLGIGGINQNAGFASPFISQAAQYANNAAQPITGGQIAQYQSPYTQQVVNATEAQFANQNAQQQSALTGNAAAQGALGGDRVGVAQGILGGQQALAQAPVIAGLYNTGFQNAEQLALTQQQAQANAAYSLGNLGVAGQQAALSGAGAQVGAGSLEQQTQQAQDAAAMQQFMQQQAYPFQTAQWLAGIDTGVGSQMGGTSQTTAPPPNPFNSILGLGLAGAGVAGGLGWKPFSARGGRIRGYDTGGGIGGLPYTGVSGFVPGMQITPGHGPPPPPKAPGQQNTGLSPTQIMGFAKGLGGGNKVAHPLDLTDGFASGEALGSLQDIGSAPAVAGLGDRGIYRDGGAVRHFEDGGLALAGYGTGSVMPDDLPGWAIPTSLKGDRLDRIAEAPAVAPSYEPTAVQTIPVRKPSIGDADLPPEITSGSSSPAEAPEDTGVLAYGPGAARLASGLGGAPATDETPAGQESPSGGGFLSRLGAGLADPAINRSLMSAGFGLMASKSPFLGQAVGEAGLAGMGTYSGIQEEKRKAQKTEADIEHGRKQLDQAAKIAADRLKAEQTHWTGQLEQQKAVLGETQRQHDTQAKHQEATLEETRRSREATLAEQQRQHELNREKYEVPAGFRKTAEGGLEAIPGGPHDPGTIGAEAKAKLGAGMSDAAVEITARQLISGDLSGLTNIGRGTQGDQKLTAIRNKAAQIMTDEFGYTPQDAAAHLGEKLQAFKASGIGQSAEARTAATREANLNLILKATDAAIPAAIEASRNIYRTGWVPINKIIQKGEVIASNPELREFGMANLQLAEHWARAMNPTGVMRESDREKALDFLSTADSPQTYERVVNQLQKQITRERDAVRSTRGGVGPAAPSTPVARSAADTAALDWASKNPTDPRAAQIRQRLGVQ